MNKLTNKDLELRMYFLVMYNLSPIQKGIQCGHAALEYSVKYGQTKLFKDFVNSHKTWIILDGGTSNSGRQKAKYDMKSELGTMELYRQELIDNKIPFAEFYEPDLNWSLSSLCFIVDERVWNRKLVCEEIDIYTENPNSKYFLSDNAYKDWLKDIGGEQNHFLREFLTSKKLAL